MAQDFQTSKKDQLVELLRIAFPRNSCMQNLINVCNFKSFIFRYFKCTLLLSPGIFYEQRS